MIGIDLALKPRVAMGAGHLDVEAIDSKSKLPMTGYFFSAPAVPGDMAVPRTKSSWRSHHQKWVPMVAFATDR